MSAIGLLALGALAGCGPSEEDNLGDSLAACFPKPFHGSCVEDVALDVYGTCYDGSGSCMWSQSRDGNDVRLVIEWENGARIESMSSSSTSSTTIQAASGERCMLLPTNTSDCAHGYRFSGGGRWYEYCIELNQDQTKIEDFRYTCDNGEQLTLQSDQLTGSPTMCPMQPLASIQDCVDAEGRRLGDADEPADPADPPPDPPCQGAACGDIGARCTEAMPCDQGLTCDSYGLCMLSCEDGPCPAGTRCMNIQVRGSGQIARECLRSCREQAECDAYGTRCVNVTATIDGFCN